MLDLDHFNTVDYGGQASLQLLCLSGGIISSASTSMTKDETNSMSDCLACSPSISVTSLVLRGLRFRTSSSSYSSSSGLNSTLGLSRGMIMVPLLLRLGSFGLDNRARVGMSVSEDEAVDKGGDSASEVLKWSLDVDMGSPRAGTGAKAVSSESGYACMIW